MPGHKLSGQTNQVEIDRYINQSKMIHFHDEEI